MISSPLHVTHSLNRWLPRTQNWISTLLRNLPEPVSVSVVADALENGAPSEPFPVASAARSFPIRHILTRRLGTLDRRLVSWKVERLARENGPVDLLHSHFGTRGWHDRPAADALDVPHVVSVYGFDVTQIPREFPEWQDRYPDLWDGVSTVLCEGPSMAETVRSLGCPPEKTTVQRLGIELDRYPFCPRSRDDDEPLRVLMASRFVEKKGIPDGVRALDRVAPATDIELTLVGGALPEGDDGEDGEPARIREALAEADALQTVHLPGRLPHSELIDAALDHHLFLQPSRTAANGDEEGGAPVTLIEMQATGMPIVATRHCDIPAVVAEASFLAEEANVDDLSETLRTAIDRSTDWPDLGERARAFVERNHSAEGQAERLAEIYADHVTRPLPT